MYNLIRLPLEDGLYVRDIGGHPINLNKITKWRVFFRSGDISAVQNNFNISLLYKFGIRTIINLKSKNELLESPIISSDKRFNYVNLQMTTNFNDNSENIKNIFDFIGKIINNGGIAFHCTASGERTSVVAALLLSFMDVQDKDITADYMASSVFSFHIRHNECEPIKYLDSIKNKYGKISSYLRDIGISDKTLSVIYNTFCYEL